MGGQKVFIGTLKLQGSLKTSHFGDVNLFIRHQNMEDDLKIAPQWKPYTARYSLHGKCPYQTSLQELGLY